MRARAVWNLKSLKTGGVGALSEVHLRKICARPLRERDFYDKKACMFEALLEVKLRKICTTPARESDLEFTTVKTPGAWGAFGVSNCFSRGRPRDFDVLQNTWQAQEFVRVPKSLAGQVLVDLKTLK